MFSSALYLLIPWPMSVKCRRDLVDEGLMSFLFSKWVWSLCYSIITSSSSTHFEIYNSAANNFPFYSVSLTYLSSLKSAGTVTVTFFKSEVVDMNEFLNGSNYNSYFCQETNIL